MIICNISSLLSMILVSGRQTVTIVIWSVEGRLPLTSETIWGQTVNGGKRLIIIHIKSFVALIAQGLCWKHQLWVARGACSTSIYSFWSHKENWLVMGSSDHETQGGVYSYKTFVKFFTCTFIMPLLLTHKCRSSNSIELFRQSL